MDKKRVAMVLLLLAITVGTLWFLKGILKEDATASTRKIPPLLTYRQLLNNTQIVVPSSDPKHVIHVEWIKNHPRVILLHNFLCPEECNHLITLADPRMQRSTVQTKTLEKHPDRTSFTCNLKKSETEVARQIEQRASVLTGYSLKNLEPLQVVRYTPQQFYKPHYDYFPLGKSGTKEALERGGQRTITLFVYLNNLASDETGGVTVFPKMNLSVKPTMGTALVFCNLLPDGSEDSRTLHGGQPPAKSTKYGLNIWFRQKEFK